MSNYLSNLIKEEKNVPEITDMEFALETINLNKDFDYINHISRENHEILNKMCVVSNAIVALEDDKCDKDEIRMHLEYAGINLTGYDISQEGLMDFFKGLVNKIKKKISRSVEKIKTMGNHLDNILVKVRHEIEDVEELYEKKQGLNATDDTFSYRIYHIINPEQNIEDLPKIISDSILEFKNYLEGDGIEKISEKFLTVISDLSHIDEYQDFMKKLMIGVDECVKLYANLPVSKKLKSSDIIRDNIDVVATIHAPLILNRSIASFYPKGGYMPKDFLANKKGSNLFEIRKINNVRVYTVYTVDRGEFNAEKNIPVNSLEEIKALITQCKEMYSISMNFKDNTLKKHNKFYGDIYDRFSKEVSRVSRSLTKDETSTAVAVITIMANTLIELLNEPRFELANLSINSNLSLLPYIERMLKLYK